ncbi:alcohol dehydrogenase family protein [Gammaproteobacteria bacterium]|nr:alcohol dehydrogenase family protein [Gammaproteobacteria bacterium]
MTIPSTMKAFVLTGHGDMDRLAFEPQWPTPQIADGEVLIRVGACGLNNTDVNTRTAWYSKGSEAATSGDLVAGADSQDASWGGNRLSFPRVQGADVVGEVVQGPAHLLGKRVMVDTWLRDWSDPFNLEKCGYFGAECDGGFAEYSKVDARQAHPIDSTLSDAELATFATSYITAENMLNRAKVDAGDTVLVPGASGGVGGALIQLSKRRGARTIAMASISKHKEVSRLAPDVLLPRSPEDLRAALGDERVTVVADVVGGERWPQLIDVLERGGRYTCAGAIAGPMVTMDLRTFYLRDLTFTGATIVPPGIFADLVGYIERGEICPILAATYPLADLHAAQQAFIDKTYNGNIVVIP